MCKSQGQQHQYGKRVHGVEQTKSESDMFIGTVSVEHEKHTGMIKSAETEHEEKWTEKLRINQKLVTFKLDRGADCNAVSAETLNTLDVRGRGSKRKLVAFFGQKTTPLGTTVLTCECKGQKHKIKFEITQQDVPAVVGGDTCLKLGLVKRVHNVGKEADYS